MENTTIINELNKLLKKASKKNEVPVAALILKDNKIIAKAHNKVEKSHLVFDHAEILCIKKASKKLKNWRLDDCILYVTLEPCDMCKEIIKKARLDKIYYYSKQNNNKTEKENDYIYIKNDEISNYLKSFFKNKRK